MTEIPMLSVCCNAEPIPELSGSAGMCSRCKEWTTFEPDEDEIASERQAHTPGKRVVRGATVGVIDHRDGVLIMTARAFVGTGSSLAEQEANARRLAACENACWNISTKALEGDAVADLLAALVLARAWMDQVSTPTNEGDVYAAIEQIDAALKKAKNKAP